MVHIIDEVFEQSREKDKASAMRKKCTPETLNNVDGS